MIKIMLPLCGLLVLQQCPSDNRPTPSNASQAPQAIAPPRPDTDSPIIISDGSTHLKHKNKTGGSDFSTAVSGGKTVATVNDPGYYTKEVKCLSNFPCPSGMPIPLYQNWTLDAYHADGHHILTATSTDRNRNIVKTTIYDGNTSTAPDRPENPASGDTGGKDIIQPGYALKRAVIADGHGHSYNLTCSGTPCRLAIVYRDY